MAAKRYGFFIAIETSLFVAFYGDVGFVAGALEYDQVEGAEGGEAAADYYAVEFAAAGRGMLSRSFGFQGWKKEVFGERVNM